MISGEFDRFCFGDGGSEIDEFQRGQHETGRGSDARKIRDMKPERTTEQDSERQK